MSQITADYRDPSPADDAPTRPVTLAPGRPTPADDIRVLLRKRLLFFALLLTAVLFVAGLFLAVTDLKADGWAFATVGVLALGPVMAGVLARGRSLSLARLRRIEFALFAAYYLLWVGVHGRVYGTMDFDRPRVWFAFILGYAVSVPWAFIILAYGLLIPNTGRRCLLVVGGMAVTPFAVSTANGMAVRAAGAYTPLNFYMTLAVCLGGAVALAVYGSHRIETLRRQVVAARQLGPYRLGRKLGAGGMGEVYLAEHLLLRRPCAVKLIRPDRGGDPASLDRFEREVQATATLTHPNTVQVFDYGRADDGTFYYAMEYLPGLPLDQLVGRHGPVPPGRAVHVLRQVCGALGEAHAAGLIHRDIKPGNVILCERGGRRDVAKLLDFGLVAGSGTADGVAGTPAYMSPEQTTGRQAVDARSDLYAVGAVAFFLLAGRPPFAGTVRAVMAAHRDEAATFPEEWPGDLTAVVRRCLSKAPADRFPDAEALERALAGCACAGAWTAATAAEWWRGQSALGSPGGVVL